MNRILLNQANTQFVTTFEQLPGIQFKITESIGRGASCIVYHAVGSDNTEHLLKEYYPKHLELTRDSFGRILVPEEKREIFEQGLLRFRQGCERQKSVRLSNEDLKNFTCNVQGYYAANNTEYIDMTCFKGQTYDRVQEKSVYDLMRRMRTLTQVVGNYHKAGLLHLDIKPENIYTRPKGETVEDVMLFDFDSVTPMTEIVTAKALSCTKTWAAPEQLLPEKRRNICPATDLFAIGEIIFTQLFGRHSTSAERRSFVTQYDYDYQADIFENMNPKVFPLLDELLCHTICGVAAKRYQSAEKLIAQIEKIIFLSDPKAPYLKSSTLTMQEFFVGRDEEIAEIHRNLNENRILFLHGIGGIGKSELAKHYAKEHKHDYDTIVFAPYVSDVNMLLQDDSAIPLYNFAQYPEEKLEEYCARKLRKLQELCDERTLLIVDNLDREDDPDLPKVLGLPCKLLITTRMDFADYDYGQQLYLDVLGNRDRILEIFHRHYTKPLTQQEAAAVEQIIDLVAGHTMTVELLAKQMMAGRVKPEQMLSRLQEGGISGSGKEKVRSGKDGILSARSAYGHIQTLFDLSDLDDDERYVLANLSLLSYTGISTEVFCDWCKLDGYHVINSLITDGWIQWRDGEDSISLHPVIAELCQRQQTDFAVFDTLINSIDEKIRDEKVCTYGDVAIYLPVILGIFRNAKRYQNVTSNMCSFLWHAQRWLNDNSTMYTVVTDMVEFVILHEKGLPSNHRRMKIGILIGWLKYCITYYDNQEHYREKIEYWQEQYKAIPVPLWITLDRQKMTFQEQIEMLSSKVKYYQDIDDKEKELATCREVIALYELTLKSGISDIRALCKQEGSFKDVFGDIAGAYEQLGLFEKAVVIYMEVLNNIPDDKDPEHLWARERMYQSLLAISFNFEDPALEQKVAYEYFDWAKTIYSKNHSKYLDAIECLLVAQLSFLTTFFADDGALIDVEAKLYTEVMHLNSTFELFCETIECFSSYTMPKHIIKTISGGAHMMFAYVLMYLECTAADYEGEEIPPVDMDHQKAIHLLKIAKRFFEKIGYSEQATEVDEFIEYIENRLM